MEAKFRVGDRVRVEIFKLDPKTQTRYLGYGFGTVHSFHEDDILGLVYQIMDKDNKYFSSCFEGHMSRATEIDELLYG